MHMEIYKTHSWKARIVNHSIFVRFVNTKIRHMFSSDIYDETTICEFTLWFTYMYFLVPKVEYS